MGPAGQGITDTQAWRDQAVADGRARRGPNMGPLDINTTNGGHCHANAAGMALLGTQLRNFFDPLISETNR